MTLVVIRGTTRVTGITPCSNFRQLFHFYKRIPVHVLRLSLPVSTAFIEAALSYVLWPRFPFRSIRTISGLLQAAVLSHD
jgi:hypothetical protein